MWMTRPHSILLMMQPPAGMLLRANSLWLASIPSIMSGWIKQLMHTGLCNTT